MSKRLTKAIEAYINLLKSQYAGMILKAVLFGSAARGKAGSESDADILIVVSATDAKIKDEISMAAYEIMLKNNVVLSPIVMDKSTFDWYRANGDPFYKNIRRDGVEIWTKKPARLLKSA
jgi:predicted nucleotidyltransferase